MTSTKPAPGRILLIDDDTDVVEVLKLLLEGEGHRVVAANSAAAGLEIAKDRPFDLVILDVSMPDMSGIAVARQLRADPATEDVRIAIHTAVEERWVRERFPDHDLFFAKARDVDLLVSGIAELLAAPRPEKSEPEQLFAPDDLRNAQQALRDALGLGAESLAAPAFFAALADEIAQLRELGRSDDEIAALLGTAIGRDLSAGALPAPRDKRHG